MKINMKALLFGSIVLVSTYKIGEQNGATKCRRLFAERVVKWLDEDDANEVARLLEKANTNRHKSRGI